MNRREWSPLITTLRDTIPTFPVVGVATGTLAGMATFMYIHRPLVPSPIPPEIPLVVICLAGVYTVTLTSSLSVSIRALLVAVVTATAVLVVASVAPIWLLPYGAGGGLAFAFFLQQALRGVLFGIVMVFLGSYLAAVILAAVAGWFE